MSLNNIWRILLILLMFRHYIHAAENQSEFMVDFRVNVTHIDPSYSHNSDEIKKIIDLFQKIDNDSSLAITSVTFCGAASPEGSYAWNRRIADNRRAALEKLIRDNIHIPDSIIARTDAYIPWNFLRDEIAASDLEQKDAVISIIDQPQEFATDPDNGTLVDRRIIKLKQLDNRHTWKLLHDRYFSKMRNASAVIITYVKKLPDLTRFKADAALFSSEKTDCSPAAASIIPTATRTAGNRKSLPLAIYTNMLDDVKTIPNIGLEIYLGKNWSIAGNWMYAWWSHNINHRYWRVYGGDLSIKRWLGNNGRHPFTGHHVGIYGQILTYDFEFGGKGHLGDKWTWGAGVEYGYSLPVSDRLCIDFTIGLGYARGEYKKYHPSEDCYVWDSTHRLNWFGPTKAEISLVWYIGPLKKGGMR